jgi:hypothetical protein
MRETTSNASAVTRGGVLPHPSVTADRLNKIPAGWDLCQSPFRVRPFHRNIAWRELLAPQASWRGPQSCKFSQRAQLRLDGCSTGEFSFLQLKICALSSFALEAVIVYKKRVFWFCSKSLDLAVALRSGYRMRSVGSKRSRMFVL